MTTHLEEAVHLQQGTLEARATFRLTEPHALAGGPIAIELTVEALGASTIHLMVSGDRSRGRAAGFTFEASFEGVTLTDPVGDLPYLGGPATFLAVPPGTPYRRTLILNDFVRLEDLHEVVHPGDSTELHVVCRASIQLAADEKAAKANDLLDPFLVDVSLKLDVRRDDVALVALVDRLVDEVFHGEPGIRERALERVTSLRTRIAVERWRALAAHPDASVAARVAPALHFASRERAGQVTP